MTNILVTTGPQGTGNHLFSKILSMHPDVHGWDQLLREYWIDHARSPFNDIWNNPEAVDNYDWKEHKNYFLSVSGPYVEKKYEEDGTVTSFTKYPKYSEVLERLSKHGNVQVGIIGRDQNITAQGQIRKRGVESLHNYLNKIEDLLAWNHTFLSVELAYLYRHQYIKSLDKTLIIPVDYSNEKLHYILNKDPNAKYVHYVEHSWLDKKGRDQNTGLLNDGSIPHDIK